MKQATSDMPIILFATAKVWRSWLSKNHRTSNGIWMKIAKMNSEEKSVTYGEALDEALCYGWIDGQKKSFDDDCFLQKFTPRRPRSLWSKRNREHVERLIKENKMTAAGLAEVEKAKSDGRWKQAYDSPSKATIPQYFLDELAKNKKAQKFFATLNKTNLYAIAWRLQTAKKEETRIRRMQLIIEMLAKGEKFHGKK